MRIITKKISLEPYKSRLNGSLKAYDGEELPVEFTSYNKYDIRFNNYGMLPCNVICPKDKCNSDEDITLSYPTLIERYYFCKKYVKMLGYDTKCGNDKYIDAIDYYNHTSKYQINSTKQTYEDLHNTFINYGGVKFLNWCDEILFGGDVKYNTYFYTCENNHYTKIAVEGTYNCPICNKTLDTIKYNNNSINSAHINIPILFTNTVDDMGEFSIFCDEWEEGAEYTKDSLSIYDEKVWIKYGTDYGSIYSDRYKELYFPQIG